MHARCPPPPWQVQAGASPGPGAGRAQDQSSSPPLLGCAKDGTQSPGSRMPRGGLKRGAVPWRRGCGSVQGAGLGAGWPGQGAVRVAGPRAAGAVLASCRRGGGGGVRGAGCEPKPAPPRLFMGCRATWQEGLAPKGVGEGEPPTSPGHFPSPSHCIRKGKNDSNSIRGTWKQDAGCRERSAAPITFH